MPSRIPAGGPSHLVAGLAIKPPPSNPLEWARTLRFELDEILEFSLGVTNETMRHLIEAGAIILVLLLLYQVVASLAQSFQRGLRRKRMSAVAGGTGGADELDRKAAAARAFRNGGFQEAGRLYETLGAWKDAIRAYEAGGNFRELGVLHEKMGSYRKAGAMYGKAGDFAEGGRVLAKGGEYREAAAQFLRAERYDKAGQALEKANEPREAALAYEKWFLKATNPGTTGMDVLRRAGLLFARSGDDARALELLEKSGGWAEAAEIRVRRAEKAAEFRISRSEEMCRAAELFFRASRKSEAMRCFREGGDEKRATEIEAEILVSEKRHLEAGRLFRGIGDHYFAAENFLKAGHPEEAVEAFSAGKYHGEAARILEGLGRWEEASRLHEEGGDFCLAGDALRKVGKQKEAAALYERSGDMMGAAQALQSAGDIEGAVAVLSRVSADHIQFDRALPLRGSLLVEAGRHLPAKALLVEALRGKSVEHATKRAFYDLARALEGLGETKPALETLYRIQSADPDYLDIRERIERLGAVWARSPEVAAASKTTPFTRRTPPPPSSSPPLPELSLTPDEILARDFQERFEVISKIGTGGMGEVFKVRDKKLDRFVAIKFLKDLPQSSKLGERFAREARAAARCTHPNIVIVYDVGAVGSHSYIVMEYVEGESLRSLIRQGRRVAPAEAVRILRQVASALDAAHSAGLIHRDVKPDNVLLTLQGVAKLTDFGIVHVRDQTITGTGLMVGTSRYMAPEQIRGEKIDARSDLYSLGVTFYEILTGNAPFVSGDVSYQHVHTDPVPPSQVVLDLPPEVEDVVLRLLAKLPSERYPDARSLAEDLAGIESRLATGGGE